MKEIIVDGVTYLPASVLAKQFKYTSDYIGQLCRAKKVDAQLVGRSWYVNPLSLQALRQKRYSRTNAATSVVPEVSESTSVPVRVGSPLAKATVKLHESSQKTNYAKRIDWKPLKYEDDETELLPKLTKVKAPASVRITLADSADIAIKSSSKSTSLVADGLPTVSLKGRVSVVSLEEGFDIEDEVTPFPQEALTTVVLAPVSVQGSSPATLKRPVRTMSVVDNQPKAASFTPRSTVSTIAEVGPVGFTLGEWLLSLVVVFLLLLGGLVLTLSVETVVTFNTSSTQFIFTTEDMLEVLQFFR